MFYYISGISILFVYYLSPHIQSGYRFVCDKYEQGKKFKEVIAKDKSNLYIIGMMLSTLITVGYIMFISYIQSFITSFCVKEVSKNTYQLTLFVKNKLLKFRVKIPRGPSRILQILDNNNNDITKEIEPYLNTNIVDIGLEDVDKEGIQILFSNGDFKNIKTGEILKI